MGAHTGGYDVVVVGGGAAGLFAAVVAAEAGARVCLLEQNPELGRKLAITGGGRCNIFNAETDVRSLLAHYGAAKEALYSPFSRFGVPDTWAWFEAHGTSIVVEDGKRAFPHHYSAPQVVATLEAAFVRAGGTVRCSTNVLNLIVEDEHVTGVVTERGDVRAERVIVATGGWSRPETGSTGAAFSWLEAAGHTVAHPNPALVPLTVKERWVTQLRGRVLQDAQVTFTGGVPVRSFTRRGKLLFTHFGISGPMVLNAAAQVEDLLQGSDVVTVQLNLFPAARADELDAHFLEHCTQHQNKLLKNALALWLPPGMEGLIDELVTEAEGRMYVNQVPRQLRQRIVSTVRALPCTVTGTAELSSGVVSDGGVPLTEVDTRTMASRVLPNLYIIGDALHIRRPTGGYSLQLCWTMGYIAGTEAALHTRQRV